MLVGHWRQILVKRNLTLDSYLPRSMGYISGGYEVGSLHRLQVLKLKVVPTCMDGWRGRATNQRLGYLVTTCPHLESAPHSWFSYCLALRLWCPAPYSPGERPTRHPCSKGYFCCSHYRPCGGRILAVHVVRIQCMRAPVTRNVDDDWLAQNLNRTLPVCTPRYHLTGALRHSFAQSPCFMTLPLSTFCHPSIDFLHCPVSVFYLTDKESRCESRSPVSLVVLFPFPIFFFSSTDNRYPQSHTYVFCPHHKHHRP